MSVQSAHVERAGRRMRRGDLTRQDEDDEGDNGSPILDVFSVEADCFTIHHEVGRIARRRRLLRVVSVL